MSRNSSGTYSLPAGNPVQTATTITSSWANTTLNDIANALTDSLSRSGQGGMLAPLELPDGEDSLPALTWSLESSSGWWREGSNDFRFSVNTQDLLQLTTNLMRLRGSAPAFRLQETDAAANNGLWDITASGEALLFRALEDDLDATIWLQVDRTAGVIDTINFPNGNLQMGGIEIGYRGMPRLTAALGRGTLATDSGKVIDYTGPGGEFLILNPTVATDSVIVVTNTSSTSSTFGITPGAGQSLRWYNGSGGALSTGTRGLAYGGVATCQYIGSDTWNIWGTGVT